MTNTVTNTLKKSKKKFRYKCIWPDVWTFLTILSSACHHSTVGKWVTAETCPAPLWTSYLVGFVLRQKVRDKSDRATAEQVMDPRTRMILFKLLSRQIISEVNGCISTGKEANVYHATAGDDAHLAIKVSAMVVVRSCWQKSWYLSRRK